jgi:hypothetical protein
VIEVENRRIDGEIQTGLFEFCGKVPDKFGRVSRLALLELLSKLTSAPFHFHLINEAARILYEVILNCFIGEKSLKRFLRVYGRLP